jgi:cobalt-zinc-cadmium efflux system outer membrane protein
LRTLPLLTFILISVGALPANGQTAMPSAPPTDDAHTHLTVSIDDSLTLQQVLQAAIERHPDALLTSARNTEAQALEARAESWIAGPMNAALRYQTDRLAGPGIIGDGMGLLELEPTVTVPLWRPGQRDLARQLGDAASDASDAARLNLALAVAGELRGVFWRVEELQRVTEVTERAVALARRRTETVQRLVDAGDLARSDALLARRESLLQERKLIEARAALVDAWYSYSALTGLQRRPPAMPEALVALDTRPLGEHPSMRLADAETERSAAAAAGIAKSAQGQPTLTLGPRSERFSADLDPVDSFGMILSVPFGGRRHVEARSASAQRLEAAARARSARVRRALELQRHDAEHELDVASELLAIIQTQYQTAREYALISRTSFERGELPLAELLRSEASALEAELELVKRESAFGLAVARVNEAAGVLP